MAIKIDSGVLQSYANRRVATAGLGPDNARYLIDLYTKRDNEKQRREEAGRTQQLAEDSLAAQKSQWGVENTQEEDKLAAKVTQEGFANELTAIGQADLRDSQGLEDRRLRDETAALVQGRTDVQELKNTQAGNELVAKVTQEGFANELAATTQEDTMSSRKMVDKRLRDEWVAKGVVDIQVQELKNKVSRQVLEAASRRQEEEIAYNEGVDSANARQATQAATLGEQGAVADAKYTADKDALVGEQQTLTRTISTNNNVHNSVLQLRELIARDGLQVIEVESTEARQGGDRDALMAQIAAERAGVQANYDDLVAQRVEGVADASLESRISAEEARLEQLKVYAFALLEPPTYEQQRMANIEKTTQQSEQIAQRLAELNKHNDSTRAGRAAVRAKMDADRLETMARMERIAYEMGNVTGRAVQLARALRIAKSVQGMGNSPASRQRFAEILGIPPRHIMHVESIDSNDPSGLFDGVRATIYGDDGGVRVVDTFNAEFLMQYGTQADVISARAAMKQHQLGQRQEDRQTFAKTQAEAKIAAELFLSKMNVDAISPGVYQNLMLLLRHTDLLNGFNELESGDPGEGSEQELVAYGIANTAREFQFDDPNLSIRDSILRAIKESNETFKKTGGRTFWGVGKREVNEGIGDVDNYTWTSSPGEIPSRREYVGKSVKNINMTLTELADSLNREFFKGEGTPEQLEALFRRLYSPEQLAKLTL